MSVFVTLAAPVKRYFCHLPVSNKFLGEMEIVWFGLKFFSQMVCSVSVLVCSASFEILRISCNLVTGIRAGKGNALVSCETPSFVYSCFLYTFKLYHTVSQGWFQPIITTPPEPTCFESIKEEIMDTCNAKNQAKTQKNDYE